LAYALFVLDWVRRLRRASRKLTLPSRDASDARTNQQLNLSKLTPTDADFLAKFASVQLLAADLLADLPSQTPDEAVSETISALAENQKERVRPVLSAIAKSGKSFEDELERFEAELQEFADHIDGRGFYENLMSIYIVFGILDDFYEKLASVQGSSAKNLVSKTLNDYPFNDFLKNLLQEKVKADEELKDSLAMFGRSLVADCLLHVLSTLEFSESEEKTEEAEFRRNALRTIEPLTNQLISNHSARMDQLGMSA